MAPGGLLNIVCRPNEQQKHYEMKQILENVVLFT